MCVCVCVQGWLQSALHRTVSGGLYFVLQGAVQDAGVRAPLLVGLVAGCLNGALLSPLAAVKYHNWGSGTRSFFPTFLLSNRAVLSEFSFLASLRSALAAGGPALLFRGTTTTIVRDAVFGVVYEVSMSCRWRVFAVTLKLFKRLVVLATRRTLRCRPRCTLRERRRSPPSFRRPSITFAPSSCVVLFCLVLFVVCRCVCMCVVVLLEGRFWLVGWLVGWR